MSGRDVVLLLAGLLAIVAYWGGRILLLVVWEQIEEAIELSFLDHWQSIHWRERRRWGGWK